MRSWPPIERRVGEVHEERRLSDYCPNTCSTAWPYLAVRCVPDTPFRCQSLSGGTMLPAWVLTVTRPSLLPVRLSHDVELTVRHLHDPVHTTANFERFFQNNTALLIDLLCILNLIKCTLHRPLFYYLFRVFVDSYGMLVSIQLVADNAGTFYTHQNGFEEFCLSEFGVQTVGDLARAWTTCTFVKRGWLVRSLACYWTLWSIWLSVIETRSLINWLSYMYVSGPVTRSVVAQLRIPVRGHSQAW